MAALDFPLINQVFVLILEHLNIHQETSSSWAAICSGLRVTAWYVPAF
jgi:hypothetical protein